MTIVTAAKSRQRLIAGTAVALLLCSAFSVLEAAARNKDLVKSYEIESQVYEKCRKSDQLISSGAYKDAIETLQEASKYDPTSYSSYVHQNLAECFRQTKQYERSINECKTALKFDPDDMNACYEIALSYYDMEHYDTAASYLQKLMQVTKDQSWINRSKSLLKDIEIYGKSRAAFKEMKAGRLEKARQLYQDASKHDPSPVSSHVHANLSWIQRQLGNPELSIAEGTKALQFEPGDKDATYGVAIAYQDIGEFDKAISWLERYLQLEKDSQKRKAALEEIKDLKSDKARQNPAHSNAPDYFEHPAEGSFSKWPKDKLPIKVFISDGEKEKGFKKTFPDYIWHALDTWCIASGNKLSYVKQSKKKDADLEVAWISEPIYMEDGDRKRKKQGLASRDESEGDIEHVVVTIDTMNGFDQERPLGESEAASVCMHEIGHALGLEHSSNFKDIMYFGASSKQTGTPTGRDKRTIARLYESYPVSKLAPVQKAPPSIKFLPPPAFMPPESRSDDDIKIPTFLPPPLQDENEKLSPPFFKPPPLESKKESGSSQAIPPVFLPPALSGSGKETKQDKKPPPAKTNKKNEKNPLFFSPAPVN